MRALDQGITIRQASEADLPALTVLMAEVNDLHAQALPRLFRPVPPDEALAQFVRDHYFVPDSALFVADRHGDLLGFIWVHQQTTPDIILVNPDAYAAIDTVVVRASERRKGIGRSLVERAHQWARDRGLTRVQLSVWDFNQDAIALYESLGYTTANRRMWRSLADDH